MAIDSSIPRWPTAALVPQAVGISVVRPVMTGPQPMSGRPQMVASNFGAWRLQLSGLRIFGGAVATARALFLGRLSQGLPVYMPFFDWRRGPRVAAGLSAYPTTPGASYVQTAGDAKIAAVAAAQSTAIRVQPLGAAIPIAGQYLGIDERVYLIAAATNNGDGTYAYSIVPPLRKPVAINDTVELADPCCRMVLDPGDMQTIVGLELDRVGALSLTFYEANWT